MKQTQTKFFSYGDTGLNICPGSKSLFQESFKKILSDGFNDQTVASVFVTGNQVTFNYGVVHGYAASRVLKINSGPLALVNNGEFVIDSVTETSLTLTIDSVPISIAGGFTTRVAPLGWELVYEQANIHIYKFKNLDESDVYIRLVYQNNLAHRNAILVCVGKAADLTLGIIIDTNLKDVYKTAITPNVDAYRWEFTDLANGNYNNSGHTPAQFGTGVFIGSKYHFLSFHNSGYNTSMSCKGIIAGVLPVAQIKYNSINYPALIVSRFAATTSATTSANVKGNTYCKIGETLCSVTPSTTAGGGIVSSVPVASQSFLPDAIDAFQTTTAEPLHLYEQATKQFLGYIEGGLYLAKYAGTNTPSWDYKVNPLQVDEVDFSMICYCHALGNSPNTNSNVSYFVAPIEEIKFD